MFTTGGLILTAVDELQNTQTRRLGLRRVFWAVLAVLLIVGGVWLWVSDLAPVVLTWETASEVGAAGFNVYRSPADEDDFTQVNEALIPAQGDEMIGASYRFEDSDVKPGVLYRYRIEEVELDGSTTVYPQIVEVRAGLPRLWVKVEGVALIAVALFVLWQAFLRR
jgi:hypothetical protein